MQTNKKIEREINEALAAPGQAARRTQHVYECGLSGCPGTTGESHPQSQCPGKNRTRKSAKGGTHLAKPTTVPEWGVIYYEAGELSAEWFDTRAEAVARAKEIYASDVFVSHVVLHGSR